VNAPAQRGDDRLLAAWVIVTIALAVLIAIYLWSLL
jgi:hypothetical protein